MSKRCRTYFINYKKEIEDFFATYYKGPKMNLPKKFNLDFNYCEIFQTENKLNHNLRNNIYEKFKNINNICILALEYKNIKVKKPFVVLKFYCTFKNCPATYNFTLENCVLNNK